MCFNEDVLSAFVDGELDSATVGEVEAHLQVCEKCRSVVGHYRILGELFQGAEMLDENKISESNRNVRQRLQLQFRREEKSVGLPFWQRRLIVPVPLAAAALFLMGLAFFAILMNSGYTQPDGAGILISQQAEEGASIGEASFSMDTSGGITAPAEAPQLEELVRFLSAQGAAIEVKIELPGSSHFEVIGEPQLIRASDYRRDADR